jgi:hypothetical protein
MTREEWERKRTGGLGRDGWPSDDVVIESRDAEIATLKQWIARLEKKLTDLATQANEAYQSDMEHGVRWMNEEVAHEFQQRFPKISKLVVDLCWADEEVE